MCVAPRKIYFYDDVSMILEKYEYPNKSTLIEQAKRCFKDISSFFISNEIVNLDFSNISINLRNNFVKNTKFDVVIIIGKKGQLTFDAIKSKLEYSSVIKIGIRRIFTQELSCGFDCEYEVDNNVSLDLSKMKSVLIVDDILYTGQTVLKVIDLLNLDNTKVSLAALVSFKDISNRVWKIYSGYNVDKYTWPNDDAELWCFKDFIEKSSLKIKNRDYISFIDDESFCKKQVFGENYIKAKAEISFFRKCISNVPVSDLVSEFDIE